MSRIIPLLPAKRRAAAAQTDRDGLECYYTAAPPRPTPAATPDLTALELMYAYYDAA